MTGMPNVFACIHKCYISVVLYMYNFYKRFAGLIISARPKFSWAILAKRSHFILAIYNIV